MSKPNVPIANKGRNITLEIPKYLRGTRTKIVTAASAAQCKGWTRPPRKLNHADLSRYTNPSPQIATSQTKGNGLKLARHRAAGDCCSGRTYCIPTCIDRMPSK